MGGHSGDGHSTTYKGFTMHYPKRWHVITGKGMCAIMWFWVLYRAKQDGPVVLGWRHPWEGHGDHSHGHGHEIITSLLLRLCGRFSVVAHKNIPLPTKYVPT